MKKKEKAAVLNQTELAPQIYDLWVKTELAKEAHAGQFVGVYPKGADKLLPRPISICEISDTYDALRLVYRVAGGGTKELASLTAGDEVELLGVLGNGYEFPKLVKASRTPVIQNERSVNSGDLEGNAAPETLGDTELLLALMDLNIVLMGGGIGIPPMLQTAKELKAHGCEPTIILGYRNNTLFLNQDLSKYGTVYLATEDGSVGTKGTVLDATRENKLNPDVILACGPMPMLRAIACFAEERTAAGKRCEAFLSLEERMACGVGACLGCVVKTKEIDAHSHVRNARICTDGPVFWARELDL